MTKNQIIQAVKKLSKSERDEVIQAIIKSNISNDYEISTEQQTELKHRLEELSDKALVLSDGKVVMDTMANKYDI